MQCPIPICILGLDSETLSQFLDCNSWRPMTSRHSCGVCDFHEHIASMQPRGLKKGATQPGPKSAVTQPVQEACQAPRAFPLLLQVCTHVIHTAIFIWILCLPFARLCLACFELARAWYTFPESQVKCTCVTGMNWHIYFMTNKDGLANC